MQGEKSSDTSDHLGSPEGSLQLERVGGLIFSLGGWKVGIAREQLGLALAVGVKQARW